MTAEDPSASPVGPESDVESDVPTGTPSPRPATAPPDPDRFARLMRLFEGACDLRPESIEAFIASECGSGDDPQLADDLRRMLAADAAPGADAGDGARVLAARVVGPSGAGAGSTDSGAGSMEGRPGTAPRSVGPRGRRVAVPVLAGEYRLIRLIGEGGMGSVYEAEQAMPRRRVAIKVIRSTFASRRLLRRFAHEAHVLGRLHHPGIAQIFEAGAGDADHPDQAFFVMEFVDGVSLGEHARAHGLDTAARLALLARVGDAVAHAHQRGVIHRDLKPANILVDAQGQPKVLDFGVARVIDGDAEVTTQLTTMGQLVGTLPYMSPEQVSGDPDEVDVRSDVYALGVILYELLSGRLPHDLSRRSIPESVRIIREVEPPRLGGLRREFRGDVETIVHKALEKDTSRRYQSAQELVADLRRFLAGEPIQARQHSTFYLLRKGMRRHRGPVAVAALLLAGVAAFSIYALRQSRLNAQLVRIARQELGVANVERGRLFARTGKLRAAEELIWPELLRPSGPEPAFHALWEMYQRHPSVATWAVLDAPVRCVAPLPDRRRIAVVGERGRLATVRLEDGAVLAQDDATLEGEAQRAIVLEGGLLAVADASGRITTWDATTLERRGAVEAHRGAARDLVGLPDGGMISVGMDGRLRRWSAALELLGDLALGESITAVAFQPGQELVAAGANSGAIHLVPLAALYGAAAMQDVAGHRVRTLKGHDAGIPSLAFSPSGDVLASGSGDRTVRFWRVADGAPLASVRRPNGTTRGVAFDGEHSLISTGWWRLETWDVAQHDVSRSFPSAEGQLCFAQLAPGRVVTGHSNGTLRLWDLAGDGARREVHIGTAPGIATFTPDGRGIVRGTSAGEVMVLDAETLEPIRRLDGLGARVATLVPSPDGRWLAGVARDGVMILWDLESGAERGRITGVNSATSAGVAWHPDGDRLVLCGRDRSFHVHEVPALRRVASLPTRSEALGVAVAPDGESFFAVSREDRIARVRFDGEIVATVEAGDSGSAAWMPAVSRDGSTLAVGAWDRTIRLLDAATLAPRGSIAGHSALVSSVAWRPGRPHQLLTAGWDGEVRLWDVHSGQSLLALEVAPGWEALDAVWNPQGDRFLVSDARGQVALWDLRAGDRTVAGHLGIQLDRHRAGAASSSIDARATEASDGRGADDAEASWHRTLRRWAQRVLDGERCDEPRPE